MVKNLPVNTGDVGSVPGSETSPGEVMATHSSILTWESPWPEEIDGLQSMGSQRVGQDSIHLDRVGSEGMTPGLSTRGQKSQHPPTTPRKLTLTISVFLGTFG